MAEAITRRDRRKKEMPSPPKKDDLKKWSELSSTEKDKIMGAVAQRLGFVKAES